MNSSSVNTVSEWKFSQVFGERTPGEEVQDVDIISTIDFEKKGDYLATGDKGGRVVIFERTDRLDSRNRKELECLDHGFLKQQPDYRYKTEFQSHEPEFDYLKSLEIEEKINKVRWCTTSNGSLFLLSSNDKTIKMWMVKERKVKKVKEMDQNPSLCMENALLAEKNFAVEQDEASVSNGYRLEWTDKVGTKTSPNSQESVHKFGETSPARCRRVYNHAHDYNLNSISTNSDGETFFSADDLRINLWNLEITDQCFNIIDMKPSNMEDLTEVITSAEFHPVHCNILAYSSSRGFIRLVDMRRSALCDQNARILHDSEAHGSKTFFTEIVASISDIKFASDGRHILSRDYMNLKLWDLRMEASPVVVFKTHEYLRPKLCDLYNNDSIFDKFECCLSGDGSQFATGSYSNQFRIFAHGDGSGEGITLEASKNPNSKKQHIQTSRPRRTSISNLARGQFRLGGHDNSTENGGIPCDLNSKLLHLAWHPTTNLIACAVANSLYLYYNP
ncbi:serine/threonine protein phosphatase 2A 55 kDa regulatory subunit B beta isoform-like [Papaver somniferum]|uniref:serine/threonine protein phosphatase 2A 55 kDa regulatory subunit B beta isoform-like n=1 Tax=Papaver somniferum TaxID=3469 RepID=UPI000E6FFFEC|nr:serine/threonine protein phosphatase 2A 55 kDa regulatory subunit B beta isoform-like [Papaver somniferum]